MTASLSSSPVEIFAAVSFGRCDERNMLTARADSHAGQDAGQRRIRQVQLHTWWCRAARRALLRRHGHRHSRDAHVLLGDRGGRASGCEQRLASVEFTKVFAKRWSAVATVAKTKELKKRYGAEEGRINTSVLETITVP